MWLTLLFTAWAAESAEGLGARDAVLYTGIGSSTWAVGMSGQPRDRAFIHRLELYGAYGLGDHWQLSGSLPGVHSAIADDDEAPCPSASDYCDPVTSAGAARVTLRLHGRTGPLQLAGTVSPWTDVWNRPSRTRYINVGQGTAGTDFGVLFGLRSRGELPLEAVLASRYHWVLGRPTPEGSRYPADAVSERLQLAVLPGRVRIGAAAAWFQRLWGEDYDPAYVREWFGTEDRWAVLRFGELRAEGQLSYALSDTSGLHASVSRVVWTVNGPPDHTDLSLGFHHWFDG